MADKKAEAAPEGDGPKPKKKLLLMIIIAALVVVLGGGGAAFFLMKKKAAEAEDEEGDEPPAKIAKDKDKKKKKKDAHAAPPVFAKLEPFVVKLQGEQERYAQAVPELKLGEAAVADQIKQYMPEIRHKILLILAGKKAEDLSSPDGMQLLANQIRIALNGILSGDKPKPGAEKENEDHDAPVQAIFFSSLIVQ